MKTLFDLYREHKGKVSDKWAFYLNKYDEILQKYRVQDITLLEIGVQNGGSLEIWSKYFVNAEKIIGCDINENCTKLVFADPKISLVVGDATSDIAYSDILSKTPTFDIVIDDGSHNSGDIVKAFAKYFSHLKDDGLFIAEDLHCSYWQPFDGGLYDPHSSISFFKALADVVNHDFWGSESERNAVIKGFEDKYGIFISDEHLSCIHSIEFYNSICIVKRRNKECNILGERVLTGTIANVVTEVLTLAGTKIEVPEQKDNYWTCIDRSPAEYYKEHEATILSLKEKIVQREQKINRLNADILKLDEHNSDLQQLIANQDAKIALVSHEIVSLRNSTSWWITQPIRIIGHQFNRIRYLSHLMPAAIDKSGGLQPLISKSFNVVRKEGMAGIKRRVIYLNKTEGVTASVCKDDYANWICQHDTLKQDAITQIKQDIRFFHWQPKISIIMPVYNAPVTFLKEAIQSVQAQLYQNWELCIADDASTEPAIRPLLESFSNNDPRIKIVFREENGHISEASNSALELATGDFIALLDNDDLLPKHALYHVAKAILNNPSVQIIYSDEDKISLDGKRCDPYFKSDWNLDLFLSQNMFSHLGVFKRELLRKINGFRIGLEGSQDYDLVLRCLDHIEPTQIVHIPKVLYHWRIIPGSTAASGNEKPYAFLASIKAVEDYLSRNHISATVEESKPGMRMLRVRYDLPEIKPLVSIIIPTRNAKYLLKQCIDSIFNKTSYKHYEIIIIDNSSDEVESLDYLSLLNSYDNITVIRDDGEFNYSRLNNMAVNRAQGEVLCLMNNDIEVITSDWLDEMVRHAMRPGVGAVGAKLLYPNNTVQHAGVILGLGGIAGHAHIGIHSNDPGYFGRACLVQNYIVVTAACLVVKKDIYKEVGGLNEVDFAVAFNDVDFCIRVYQAGYRNVWTPFSELYHHESATRGSDMAPDKIERFKSEIRAMERLHGGILKNDPSYNPNLSLNLSLKSSSFRIK